jgi:hypothetical protein
MEDPDYGNGDTLSVRIIDIERLSCTQNMSWMHDRYHAIVALMYACNGRKGFNGLDRFPGFFWPDRLCSPLRECEIAGKGRP